MNPCLGCRFRGVCKSLCPAALEYQDFVFRGMATIYRRVICQYRLIWMCQRIVNIVDFAQEALGTIAQHMSSAF